MYVEFNPNPSGSRVGDCTVRAISKALRQSWEKTYIDLCLYGLIMCDMPSANSVWGKYLKDRGFRRHIIPDSCPDCYSVNRFAEEHKKGTYILALNGHVVACEDGNIYDTWNSSDEIPIYYWQKEE